MILSVPPEWIVFLSLGIISILVSYPKKEILNPETPVPKIKIFALIFGSFLTGFFLYTILWRILSN